MVKVKTICRSETGMHAGDEAGYLQSAAQLKPDPAPILESNAFSFFKK